MEPTKPNVPSLPKRRPDDALHARKLAQRLVVGVAVLTLGMCALAIRSVAHRRTYVAPTLVVTQRPRFEPRTPQQPETTAAPSTVATAPTHVAAAPSATAVPTTPAPTSPAQPSAAGTTLPSDALAAAAPASGPSSGVRLTLTSARIATPQGTPGSGAATETAPSVATERSASPRDTEAGVAVDLAAVELELARAEVRGDAAATTRLEEQRKDLLRRLRAAVVASQAAGAQAPVAGSAPPVTDAPSQGAAAANPQGATAQGAAGASAPGATGATAQKTHDTAMTAAH